MPKYLIYSKRLFYLVFSIYYLLLTQAFAQLTITPATTNGMATSLVGNVLIGKGVTFSNVTWNGQFHNDAVPNGSQIGSFSTGSNPTNLGISNGIIMSTGDVLKAPLPNNLINSLIYTDYYCICEVINGDIKCLKNLPGCQRTDVNLESLQGCTNCTFDATYLEFDFTPASNQISFKYVFASDEYPNYVCSPTNDLFGFFVTGPKPGGGNYLSQNIALIPGTNLPVEINTVNSGKAGGGYNSNGCISLAYSSNYINNSKGASIVYNAFTKVFTARLDVIPCNTYHIKLAIADVGDGTYDSSVFIEAKSFSITTPTITFQNSAINDSAAVRGCSDAIVTINTPKGNTVSNDSVVQLSFTGNAVPGIDYTTIPNNITTNVTIPKGDSSVSFKIHPLCTSSKPGELTVNLNLSTCAIVSTFPIKIMGYPQITATPKPDTTICLGESAKLSLSNITGGLGIPYSYTWSSNPAGINSTAANLTVNPTITTTYTVKINDGCSTCSSNTYNIVVNVVSLTISIITTEPTIFCSGGSVLLNASPSSGLSYQWQNNGINIGGATTSAFSASISGNYSVVVFKGNNCSATSQVVKVTANPLPTAIVTPRGVTTFCQGGSVILDANTGAGLNYQWQRNGTNIAGATMSSYTATTSGSYNVIVTNSNNCTSKSTAVSVIANPLPTAIITPQGVTTFCQGGSVNLDANAVAGLNYQWQRNGANIAGATLSSYTATTSGSYTVVVTNSNNCTSTSTAVSVIANPLPTAIISPKGVTTFCQGGSVNLDANTGAGLNYQWQRNGTNIAGATISSYTATSSGNYTVIISNSNNCTSTSTDVSVIANPLPTATITPQGSTTFCQGDSLGLNANSGSGLIYQWQNNGADLVGKTTSFYTVNVSGKYTVIITNIDNCTSTSQEVSVTINPIPTATITPQGQTTFCQGGSVILNANTGNSLNYQWQNNGNNIDGATISSYTAKSSGNYTVIITNSSNCYVTSQEVTITANPMPAGTINPQGPTTFCLKDSVVLIINTSAGTIYQWKKNGTDIAGATISAYTAYEAGIYSVIISNISNCTLTSDNLTVSIFNPTAILSSEGATSICKGSSVLLKANTITDYSYQWKKEGIDIPGASNTFLTVDSEGSYSFVMSKGAYCIDTSTVQKINVTLSPVASIYPPGPFTICTDSAITISANFEPGLSYQWQKDENNIEGATRNIFTFNTKGNYTVIETDSIGCFGKQSVITEIKCPPLSIHVPNAFTPDDPELNKIFYTTGTNITNYKIDIYNKWGALVFQSDDIKKGWDGKYNNADCPIGTYVYIIYYEGNINGYNAKKIKKGAVTLLR